MSTSIILLDENFNANDVDIMVFEPCVCLISPCRRSAGNIEHMVRKMDCADFAVFSSHLKKPNLHPFLENRSEVDI